MSFFQTDHQVHYTIATDTSPKTHEFKVNKGLNLSEMGACLKRQLEKVGSLSGRISRWLNTSIPGHLIKAAAFAIPATLLALFSLSFAVKSASEAVLGLMSFATLAGIPAGLVLFGLSAMDALVSYGLFHLTIYCSDQVFDNLEAAFLHEARKEKA